MGGAFDGAELLCRQVEPNEDAPVFRVILNAAKDLLSMNESRSFVVPPQDDTRQKAPKDETEKGSTAGRGSCQPQAD